MTLEAPIVRSDATAKSIGRWGQLACGVVCMVMIANLQYGWTLFVQSGHPRAHHDALEFPDGQIVLLTLLHEGQHAAVLQLPATHERAKAAQPNKAKV